MCVRVCHLSQVKDYDRKRSRAEKALEAQDWEAAEKAFIDALHVSLLAAVF